MKHYSDLAVESRELYPKKDKIFEEKFSSYGFSVGRININESEESEKLSRPIGNYTTVELPSGFFGADSDKLTRLIFEEVKRMMPQGEGTLLFAGLGNRAVTPDALGPKTADKIIATRHITKEFAEKIGLSGLKSVAAVSPGVLGQTGIETAETVKSAVDIVNPKAVVTVDALTAHSPSRLGNTIQITDSGISPGSGVGNRRAEISKKTLGVPVISIGVPTVVNATSFIKEEGENTDIPDMIVTPKDIDSIVDIAAGVIGMALNSVFQPEISIDVLKSYM